MMCCENVKDIIIVIADMEGGGAQRVVSLLANYWAKQGKKISLITFKNSKSDMYVLNNNIKRISIDFVSQSSNKCQAILFNFIRILKLRNALKKEKSVHVVSFIFETNVLTILSGFGLGKKIYISERNNPYKQSGGLIWGSLRKVMYRYAKGVVANNSYAEQYLKKYVKRKKIHFINNPVIIDYKKNANFDNKVILVVSRLHPQKGLDILFNAFSMFLEEYPEWKMWVVGIGDCESKLRDLSVNLKIEKNIKWFGNQADVAQFYKEASIFCLPSMYEGTSNSLLEALSYGVPSITSDAVFRENDMLKKHVKTFTAGDPFSLSEVLKKIARNDIDVMYSELECAKEYIASEYEIGKISSKWMGILNGTM